MTVETLLKFIAFPLTTYVIGSIPFGYVLGRLRGIDLRTQGSRNIGATNVGRVLGARWGYLCFALDVLKGLLPVLVAGRYIHGSSDAAPAPADQAAWMLVALAAILGHVFTVFLKFRGGKGVATSLGVVLGFYPYFTWCGLAAFALWIVAVKLWKYVSLASIIAAGAFPVLFVIACQFLPGGVAALWPLLAFATTMAALVIFRHRANISRLLSGTENKIGQGKKP